MAELDEDDIAAITRDVMRCLIAQRFFEKLDDALCPADQAVPAACTHSFAVSENLLTQLGFDAPEQQDIFAVLHANGACCDCEILYNVAETSRLKSRYWRASAEKRTLIAKAKKRRLH